MTHGAGLRARPLSTRFLADLTKSFTERMKRMHLSPALERFLAAMEYPATRDDLLREAARDGLPAEDRERLASLPEQSYSAAWYIRYRLARRALADALAPAEPAVA